MRNRGKTSVREAYWSVIEKDRFCRGIYRQYFVLVNSLQLTMKTPITYKT